MVAWSIIAAVEKLINGKIRRHFKDTDNGTY